MGKGLPRSLKNASPKELLVPLRRSYDISGSLDITGAAGLVDAGTFVLGGLPEGNILFLGAIASVVVDGTDADVIIDWDGDFGIGTIPNADLDLGDAGDDDIITSTALVADTGLKATLATRGQSLDADNAVILDNTDGSLELNFNLLIDDNVITDAAVGTFVVSGTLLIVYIFLGDD